MKTIDMTDEEMEQTFQDILENGKDDPDYAKLIERFNSLKAESIGIMEAHGDMHKAFELGKESGAVENRILEMYDAKQE